MNALHTSYFLLHNSYFSMFNPTAYLGRIQWAGSLPVSPTLDNLRRLQLAHLLAVPFENLSIHLGQPIVLEEAALFHKIVTQRRGGFCYELNGLFALLLRALGYPVQMLSAGVFGSGVFGPEFDHMALLVRLEEYWLVDVGFGDSFRQPLRLEEREAQEGGDGRLYRLAPEDESADRLVLWQQTAAQEEWLPQYRFSLRPYTLADYAEMCHFHQTSPESPFTQKRVCTLATPNGRCTLSHNRFITTADGVRTERVLADEGEIAAVLQSQFGITL